MNRIAIVLTILALSAAGCGPISGPACREECDAEWQCPPGEPNPNCEAGRAECYSDCSEMIDR